ncbi:MAG: PAS domain S-box protein [Planctomycetota bacterium]|nr:MAG: PAS domain S-box protein [Planctomycetota bacterium]
MHDFPSAAFRLCSQRNACAVEHLRSLLRYAPDAMMLIGPQGLIDCNDLAVRMLRTTRDAIAQQISAPQPPATDTNGPESGDEHRPDASAGLLDRLRQSANDGPAAFTWQFTTSADSPVPVEMAAARVPDAGEELWLVRLRDLTPRREVEQRLEESLARFRQIAEHLDDALWLTSADGREIVYMSPAYEKIWGRSSESLMRGPQDVTVGVHPDDRARVRRQFYGRHPSAPLDQTFRLLRPDGTIRWVRNIAFPVTDGTGRVHRIAGITRDITDTIEHKQALHMVNQRLQRKSVFLHTLLDSAHQAIIATDQQGTITIFNRGAECLLGIPAPQVCGRRKLDELIDPRALEAWSRQLQRELGQPVRGGFDILTAKLRQHDVDTRECTFLDANGRPIPVLLSVSPVTTDDGTLTGYLGVAQDIRERKQWEAELRAAKEAAEQASTAKSSFLAQMSHEIRTPLTAILGFADVLARGLGTPAQRSSYVETIRSAGGHLLTLVDDILDLSKIEAGRIEVRLDRCCPTELVAGVLAMLRMQAEAKGIDLTARWLTPAPRLIRTDPTRVRQLLTNIVGNAIKYTDHGSVRLELRIRDEEPRLEIAVRDTGPGISEKTRRALFEPFVRGDHDTVQRVGGTGLGVCISRALARALGGDIGVESEIGRGTTFRITLETGPLDSIPQENAGPVPLNVPVIAAHTEPVQLPPAHILIVEDGEANRNLLKLVLQEAGAHVVTAANGRDGVELAGTRRFDLVLMDIRMPVMDGYAATRQLRERGFDRPIIALTAHSLREDRERCLTAGCTDFVTKPIDFEKLLAAVAKALQTGPRYGRPDASDSVPLTDDRPLHCSPRSGRPELAHLLQRFREQLLTRIATMRTALERQQRHRIRELAHWLKGTGGTMGFDEFTAPASQLESRAIHGSAAELLELIDRLESLATRIPVPEPETAVHM